MLQDKGLSPRLEIKLKAGFLEILTNIVEVLASSVKLRVQNFYWQTKIQISSKDQVHWICFSYDVG